MECICFTSLRRNKQQIAFDHSWKRKFAGEVWEKIGCVQAVRGLEHSLSTKPRDRLARGHCGWWLGMFHVKPDRCRGAGGCGGGDTEVATCPPSFPVPKTRNTGASTLRNTETKNPHWYFGHLVAIQWLLSRSCMFGFTHTTSSPVRRDGVVFSILRGVMDGLRAKGDIDDRHQCVYT